MTDAPAICTIPHCDHTNNLKCPKLRAELEALGVDLTPLPPDHPIYQQGTVFIIPNPPAAEPETDGEQSEPRAPLA